MYERPCGDKTVQNVGCKVQDCVYHTTSDICTARHIIVSNEKAQRKAETFCSTFENKEEF